MAENLRYWSCCKRTGGLGISASSSLDKTNPRTRFGLLATGPQAQLTRSVNEEALECASREAISRVLTLPPSRFGLLAKPPGRRPRYPKCQRGSTRVCVMRSHRPCTVAALLTVQVTSEATGPQAQLTRSVNEEALE